MSEQLFNMLAKTLNPEKIQAVLKSFIEKDPRLQLLKSLLPPFKIQVVTGEDGDAFAILFESTPQNADIAENMAAALSGWLNAVSDPMLDLGDNNGYSAVIIKPYKAEAKQ